MMRYRRLGTEWPGGRDHTGACRALSPCLRSKCDNWRWRAFGGTHLPGFVHDVCSAVHPLAAGSPFFKTLPLERFGLEWIQPVIPLAHPLDDGSAASLHKEVNLTAEHLGRDSRASIAASCSLWCATGSSWPSSFFNRCACAAASNYVDALRHSGNLPSDFTHKTFV